MGSFINKSVGIACGKKSAFIPSFLGQVIALAKAKLQRKSCSREAGIFFCENTKSRSTIPKPLHTHTNKIKGCSILAYN